TMSIKRSFFFFMVHHPLYCIIYYLFYRFIPFLTVAQKLLLYIQDALSFVNSLAKISINEHCPFIQKINTSIPTAKNTLIKNIVRLYKSIPFKKFSIVHHPFVYFLINIIQ